MVDQQKIPAGCTALVINDSEFACNLLATMLRQIGFTTVLIATDGHSGAELALERAPQFILLDWIMPGKSGADVLHLLTACQHPFDESPVMVSSTSATRDAIVQAARSGAAGFIVQPFAQSTLASRVARVMASTNISERRKSA